MNISQMRFKLVCLVFFFGKQTSGKTCYTPDKQQGFCLPLNECSKAYDTFAQPPKGSEKHLRRFLCKNEKQLKVCCGTAANFTLSIALTPDYADTLKERLSKDAFKNCDLRSLADIDLPVILAETVDSEVKPKKCLGILANPRYVITPAQCVGQQFRLIGVQFRGKNNNSITFGVEDITSHPFFDPVSGVNDIALLRLNQTVSSDDVASLCHQYGFKFSQQTLIYTNLDLFTIERGLKKTTVSTASLYKEHCEEEFLQKGAYEVVTEYDWCTNNLENATKSICKEFTGVPLFVNHSAFGIGFIGFSSSRTVCDDDLPDIYTNVIAYKDWLIDQMRPWPTKNEPCTTPNGELGECWNIFYCPALFDAFSYVTNAAEAAQLRGFICKEEADELFVCCVTSSNSTIAHRKYEPQSVDVLTKFLEPRLCGLQHRDDYFTSSTALAVDEFPWIALINDNCTGILINSRYVLTSTEGVYNLFSTGRRYDRLQYVNTTSIIVRLGLYDGFKQISCVEDPDVDATDCTEVEIYGIDDIIRYQFYPQIDVQGIVLLRLNKTVSYYTDFIRPICLPIEGTLTAKVGDIMYMSFWYKVATKHYSELDYATASIFHLNLSYSNQAKGKVLMQLTEKEECQRLIAKELPSNTFCARGYEGKVEYNERRSYSGALMFHDNYRWHIEGFVLWKNSGQEETYGFVNVSRYISWIVDNMKPW